jgi:hypothetical protein
MGFRAVDETDRLGDEVGRLDQDKRGMDRGSRWIGG